MFAQDKPELPGWGVYVGGGSMGIVADDMEGVTWSRTVGVPILGISRGLWAGPVPLSVGAGLGKRGYTQEMTTVDFFTGEEGKSKSETQFTTLDIWATVPYPVGPAVLQVGFVMGMSLSGTSTTDFLGTEIELALEGDMLPDPDLGLMLGLAYPINDNIGINVGYAHGLTNHGDDSMKMNFNGIFALVGYNF
tara:strand:- start:167 stop:742 length:576 start_codon:yes stop_codon:yes gene_type:complete